jgi:membrane protease YdiL (CAAX protease family)
VLILSSLVIPLCLMLWLRAFKRLARGRPILPWAERRAVPWSAGAMLLCGLAGVLLVLVTQKAVGAWVALPEGPWQLEDLTPVQQIAMVLAFSVSSLLTMAVSGVLLRGVAGATWSDLGLERGRWLEDVRLGIGAYAMLVVPMLLLHILVQRLTKLTEQHPFVDLLSNDPRFGYLLPIGVAALLAAPLAEEFFFRLVLQGWLERLMTRGSRPADPVGTELEAVGTELEAGFAREPEGPPESRVLEVARPLPSWPGEPLAASPQSPVPQPPALRARLVPIFVSALVFALAHVGQGAAPVALFFLALGLGYLYQRTHRLLPSVVTHFLINFTAVLQLWEFLRLQAK